MSVCVGVNCNCDAWQLNSLIHLQHVKDLIASLLFLTLIRSIGYGSYLDPTRWHHSVPRKGGVSLVRIAPWHDGWTRTLASTTSQTTASDRWRTLAPPSPPSKWTAPRSPRLPHALFFFIPFSRSPTDRIHFFLSFSFIRSRNPRPKSLHKYPRSTGPCVTLSSSQIDRSTSRSLLQRRARSGIVRVFLRAFVCCGKPPWRGLQTVDLKAGVAVACYLF